MTVGFNLAPSSFQAEVRDRLHVVAKGQLRAMAAQAESEGFSLALLSGILRDADVAPAQLLQRGIDSPHTLLIAVEELAYGDAGVAWAALAGFQVATVIDACGSGEQKGTVLRVLSSPDSTASVLLYEDFGRQPSEHHTTATTNEPTQVVHGHKCSVAYPFGADLALLVARQGDDLVAFCLRGHRPELIAERDDRDVGKLAVTAVPSGPVRIEGLTVTSQERLRTGIELHRAVGQARLLLAAVLVGVARASLEFAAAYATQRTTWGKTLATYQGVAFPLIEHTTELHEVRLLLWDVADKVNRLDRPAHIEWAVARAVNKAASLGLRATRNGVQLVGVRAISRDLPCERWYRAAAVLAAIDFDILQTPFGLS